MDMNFLEKKSVSANDFNVIGSSNGIMITLDDPDIHAKPFDISIFNDNLSLSFKVKDKNNNVNLTTIDIPCKKSIYVACKNKSKKKIDCLFVLVSNLGKNHTAEYYKLKNPIQ